MLIAHSFTNILPPKLTNSLQECQQKATKNGCICIQNNENFNCECSDQEEFNKKSGKCEGKMFCRLIFNEKRSLGPNKFVLMSSRNQFIRFKINQDPVSFENVYTKVCFDILIVLVTFFE